VLRDAAVALIQEQLGFRSDLESNIITHLQLAQLQLEKSPTKPWFLIAAESFVDTVADTETVAVPTGFIQEVEQAVLRYVPDDSTGIADEVDLSKNSYDVLRTNFREVESGAPQAYALLNETFHFFPLPDAVYRIRMIFYGEALPLTSNIENVWLEKAPKLLMGVAGKEIAAALRDSAAMATFDRWEKEDRLLIYGETISREMANFDLQVGGPHV